MLPAAALAQEDSGVTVYINGSSGRDTNEGLTSSAPVQTMGKALELAGEGGTIVILGTVYIREDVTIENVTVKPVSYTHLDVYKRQLLIILYI